MPLSIVFTQECVCLCVLILMGGRLSLKYKYTIFVGFFIALQQNFKQI